MVGLMEKEVEYISDGNYNYLRIDCGENRNDTYAFKMMTENEIKGLVPCRIRFINGNTYLYYEIQSKQAIYHRYETREIDYEALKNIFLNLCLLGEELEKYLLDVNDVDFDERYIYQNIETGETYFLLYPGGKQRQSFAAFMEYIVKRINHKDVKAVQVSYQLYDLSRKERILVKEIKQLFEEEPPKDRIERKSGNIEICKEETEKEWKTEINQIREQEDEKEEWEYTGFEVDTKQKEENSKLSNILIPSVFCIILTVLICIKISVPLTYNQETLVIAGIVVDVGIFMGYFGYRLWLKSMKKKEKVKSDMHDFEEEGCDLYRYASGNKLKENAEWDDMDQMEESYGKTVFMEPEAENILCGLGKYEKIVIKLEKFPFSIGKLKEEADYVLKDNSVSRLHARFYQDGKSIYLMDLNSTNGTYKNGFKIPPNEKVLLEEGDEVVFGKIRFCYR